VKLIIRPERVLDCTGADSSTGLEVVTSGERIEEIRPAESGEADGAQVIEAPGMTLMPGLMDLHIHLFQWGQRHDVPWERESILEAGLRGIRNARSALELGVTTVRDVACRDNLSIQLRDLIRAGQVVGPRLLASGTQLEASGRAAYFFRAIYVNGPDEVRAATRRQLRAGADWIKVMATSGVGGGTGHLISEPGWQELTEEELRAAAIEAHGPGRKITAHAIGNSGIKAAVRAGFDCIEHGDFLDEEAIEMMVERNTALVPTLTITRNLGEHGAERGFEQNIVDRAQQTLEAGFASTLAAWNAGIRVAAGSDVDLDETAAEEVRMLHRAGLPKMAAIMAATSTAASVIDLDHELGTVESNKIADLLLVEGDPLEDLGALDRVRYVIQGGVVIKSPDQSVVTSPLEALAV